jgi:hypothetical protein
MIELDGREEGAVALLTLKRPPANAFTPEGLLPLQRIIKSLNGNARVRAVVITGDGPKFFSAGADLNTFADGNREVARVAAARFGAAFESLQNARALVIAAINGYAMGGFFECALACDIRIAESHAQLALPETAVGLLPCGCGTQTLPALVGEGWAKRIILTGERVDAHRPRRRGGGKGRGARRSTCDGRACLGAEPAGGRIEQAFDPSGAPGCAAWRGAGRGTGVLRRPVRWCRSTGRCQCLSRETCAGLAGVVENAKLSTSAAHRCDASASRRDSYE